MQRNIRKGIDRELKNFFDCQIENFTDADKQSWRNVIVRTITHFKGTEKYELIIGKYYRKMSEVQICLLLNVEKTTYYNWLNEVLGMTFIFAVLEGLIKYDADKREFCM